MTHDQYLAAKDTLLRTAEDIESSKRPAYTIGSEDVLANFKRVAERTGQTPGQVLATYMLKHVDAVTSALCRPDLPQAEAILGRFADLINYAKLGYALIEERGPEDGEGGLVDRSGDRIEKKTCSCGETDTCAKCPPHVRDAVKAAEYPAPRCPSLYTERGKTYRCDFYAGHLSTFRFHGGSCVSGDGSFAQWFDEQAIN